jgi:hypothetical protein
MTAGSGLSAGDLSYSFRVGSLRNPVGPLPSSVYWRRRAVALSVVGLLLLLIVWAVNSDGDSHGENPNGKGPAESITPGPSSSGPAISERPGGRDESEGEGAGGSGGTDGSDGSGGSGGSGGGGTGGDGEGDFAGVPGSGDGAGVPAGSSLPDCTPGALTLSVRSVKSSYDPDEKPTFKIAAKNSSGKSCKVDLGDRSAVLTITLANHDDPLWSSDDCPESEQMLYLVPAEGDVVRTVEWDRKASEPKCATPQAGSADPGTYRVKVTMGGFVSARDSFSLSKA